MAFGLFVSPLNFAPLIQTRLSEGSRIQRTSACKPSFA